MHHTYIKFYLSSWSADIHLQRLTTHDFESNAQAVLGQFNFNRNQE